MPIVQVPLDIDDDIYKRVLDGTLKIMGMAVDGQYKIRKHIPSVKLPKVDKTAQEVRKIDVIQIVKAHKAVVIGVGIVAAVTGAVAFVHNEWKNRRMEDVEERIDNFQNALKAYLKASKKGKLNARVVDDLLESLEKIEKEKLGKDIELTLPASQLTELIFSIFTYTETLAKANSFDVKIPKPKSTVEGNIISLKSYLEIQRQILENVA